MKDFVRTMRLARELIESQGGTVTTKLPTREEVAEMTRPKSEFAGVEAMGYATREEAENAARRWVAEQDCDVHVRAATAYDQAMCDLGDAMQWVVEQTEYPGHTNVGTAHSPEDGGWYAFRHSHAYDPSNDLFTGVHVTKAEALAAARAGEWV